MTPYRIAWRSLFHEWHINLALALAIAMGVAVLLGAFSAGDTLQAALRHRARETIGRTELALLRSSGTFREQLVDDLSADTRHQAAPVLRLRGVVTTDGGGRLPAAWIVGVNSRFGRLGDATPFNTGFTQDALLNRAAAKRLGVHGGDEIVVRVARPASLPGEAALAAGANASAGLRMRVGGIVEDAQLGRFALEAQSLPPENVFLPLTILQELVGMPGRVNLALLSTQIVAAHGGGKPAGKTALPEQLLGLARGALQQYRQLDDLGLEFRTLPGNGGRELRSAAFWIDPEAAQAALVLDSHAGAVATYLVKEIICGTNVSPYAFVAGGAVPGLPWPADDNAIVLNDWLSSDLGAATGDTVTIVYDTLGAGRTLQEASRNFRVSRIVPVAQVDPQLMPEMPGIGDAADCRDWRGGAFVDTRWIRPKDQEYWAAYRGTPRALVSLNAARAMWSTRWGVLTGVRFAPEAGAARELAVRLLAQLPEDVSGWQWIALRERLLQASEGSQDFAVLFVMLSMVLVAAAVFLSAMLFGLRADRRRGWIGLLRAVGYRAQLIQKIFLIEGAVLVALGSAVGVVLGLGYARLVLHTIDGIWAHQAGFAGEPQRFEPGHVLWAILAVGGAALAVQGMVLAWAQRQEVRDQLAGGAQACVSRNILGAAWEWYLAALLALALAGAALAIAWANTGAGDMPACLAGGILVMLAGLLLLRALLVRKAEDTVRSLPQLGVANAARRIGRGLLSATLVALAVFLLMMLGAVRPQLPADAGQRKGPTGGYGWCAETAQPLFALPQPLQGTDCLALRVQEGDDASCLNPQQALTPRVAGVPAQLLAERGAFSFADSLPESMHPGSWLMLDDPDENAVPAVVDESTLMWGLKKKLGDKLILTDDAGRTFPARLVGALRDSVFQGMVLIDESAFSLRYPSVEGYRMLLFNAPDRADAAWTNAMEKALDAVGGALQNSGERLRNFQRVTRVYLDVFTTLGWLALLLAIVGVSLTMAHQAQERRGEIACLRAMGLSRADIGKLLLVEQGLAIVAGAVSGTAGALAAILPMGAQVAHPAAFLQGIATLAFVLLCGMIATAAVVRIALNRPLVEGLQEE